MKPTAAQAALATQGKINTMIDPAIFRAYDIRGVVGDTLTDQSVYDIGRAIGSQALDSGDHTIAIGRDGRLSGPTLSAALRRGILATGCNIIDIGLVPTPLLYYTTFLLGTRSGVMLTGSHNPPEYNGLKIMIAGHTLAEEGITGLYQRIIDGDLKEGEGEYHDTEIIPRYIRHVAQDVRLDRPLRIVIDCGNGAAGAVAPALFREMGCDVIELYCDIDGHFPNHHPDPSQVDNLHDLIRTVHETNADIGLAFDGDGDRLGVVTSEGDVIWPDRLLMLLAKSILATKPGATIIYDVKCTRHLADHIRACGGEPLMWKTGHSLIKSKLAETGALLAGEMSGHIFFRDRWYGFDDALYAAARLLHIIADDSRSTADIFRDFPDSINTPELKIAVADREKFDFLNQLAQQADFCGNHVSTIDGLRVNFADGWGLIRPSNTTPCLVLRFEADTQLVLEHIQDIFRRSLLAIRPDLVLPF